MVVVAMVAVIVVVVVVVKVLVRAEAIIDMVEVVEALIMGVLADVEIIVVGVIVVVLKFVLPAPYSVDVLSGVGNTFVVAMATLEFPVPTPLEELSRPLALLGCATPFDCRTLALLDCTRVLQARMPSYHV